MRIYRKLFYDYAHVFGQVLAIKGSKIEIMTLI